jgi:hypothetical protein
MAQSTLEAYLPFETDEQRAKRAQLLSWGWLENVDDVAVSVKGPRAGVVFYFRTDDNAGYLFPDGSFKPGTAQRSGMVELDPDLWKAALRPSASRRKLPRKPVTRHPFDDDSEVPY